MAELIRLFTWRFVRVHCGTSRFPPPARVEGPPSHSGVRSPYYGVHGVVANLLETRQEEVTVYSAQNSGFARLPAGESPGAAGDLTNLLNKNPPSRRRGGGRSSPSPALPSLPSPPSLPQGGQSLTGG